MKRRFTLGFLSSRIWMYSQSICLGWTSTSTCETSLMPKPTTARSTSQASRPGWLRWQKRCCPLKFARESRCQIGSWGPCAWVSSTMRLWTPTAWFQLWGSWQEKRRRAATLICYCRQTCTHFGGPAGTSLLAGTTKKRRKIARIRTRPPRETSGPRNGPSSARTTSTTSGKSSSNTRVASPLTSRRVSTTAAAMGTITVTSSNRNTRSSISSTRVVSSSRITANSSSRRTITGAHLWQVDISSSLTTTRVVTTTTISNFSSTTTTGGGVGFEIPIW